MRDAYIRVPRSGSASPELSSHQHSVRRDRQEGQNKQEEGRKDGLRIFITVGPALTHPCYHYEPCYIPPVVRRPAANLRALQHVL